MIEEEKRKYVKLDEQRWLQIETEYQIGDTTLEDLSARHGPSVRAIQMRFRERGIERGAAAPALAPAVQRRSRADTDDLMAKAKEVRQQQYDGADLIERLVLGQLEAAQADPSSAAKTAGVMKALSLAAAALERTSTLKRQALGIDSDSAFGRELPVLTIDDITQEEINAIQRGDEDSNDEIVDEYLPAECV
ncbi:hypothetical protein GCM10011390_51170 [Aureimonas endophytica]|uniref:Uncharacterized protein n=2 Tax=Aureimonas endophytica TaxID=2027858 RepID=A0A917EDE2_9HYPH|nr:hypothetical protein GCM10011390_51170 [Aureimonas endophytica]